jgi:8-oxo-dGTP diphosphatase
VMARREETERDRLRRIAILNARLPKKRNIAQGVLRDTQGRLLLCELSYKPEWDLPGGVVDPAESPATCVEREVLEELGIAVTAGRLLAVNWLPPWRGWDDAHLFLFDLGVHETGELDPDRFLRREIADVHWCTVEGAAAHVAPYTARMLEVAAHAEHTAYLENSEPTGT